MLQKKHMVLTSLKHLLFVITGILYGCNRYTKYELNTMKKCSYLQGLLTFGLTLFALYLVYPLTQLTELNLKWFVREPAAMSKINPFTGYLSNLGLLCWAVTAGICIFTAAVLFKWNCRTEFYFYLYAAVLSLVLLFDDMFMFHEVVFSQYLGIGEKKIYVFYLLAGAGFIWLFRKIILKTKYYGLILALVFMGLSVFFDYIQEPYLYPLGQYMYLLEEGVKWIGIGWWLSYFIQTSAYNITGNLLDIDMDHPGNQIME